MLLELHLPEDNHYITKNLKIATSSNDGLPDTPKHMQQLYLFV
jgi:hypothetical protein